ncbi:MAG TPA: HEAT repeat domain-containing protein [Bryobacteraceae bacterium]|nr:HEAT repeat domain-containing protein [Bryobacteraceae bacterium]
MRPSRLRLLIPILLFLGLSYGQSPRIGTVDFYGLRKTSESTVRKALRVHEGDPLPQPKADIEEQLEKLPGIVRAHLEATCCDDGKAILYVGLEEKGAPHFDYRKPPAEELSLPPEIIQAYAKFLQYVEEAGRRGVTGEDLTRGHSLMADPAARLAQEKFVSLASDNLEAIRKVLRNSVSEENRAMAAYVIGYTRRKPEVVNDLLYALQDSDDTVRSNAIRSLGAFAVLAELKPDAGLKISPTWFIEMLNSIVWTDRNNAAVSLVNLTEHRDARTLAQLRERALPALIEMARWKHLAHALPAYILLGRVLGVPEAELQEKWSKGERESVIRKAAAGKISR